MKIVTYNIQYGKGKDGCFNLPRIADEVRGADVIALQEVERFWARSGQVDQPAVLSELLGDYYPVYGAGVDLSADGSGVVKDNRRRQFGNMLLSHTPILMSRNHLLPKFSTTGPLSLQRSALEGVINTARGPIRVYSIHLTHLSKMTRLPQIERVLEIHRTAVYEGAAITVGETPSGWEGDTMPPAMPRSALLLGDFNFVPASSEYERIVGPVSDYGGRMTNLDGFVDAWTETGNPAHTGVTGDIQGCPVRLDYCFASTDLAPALVACTIDETATGSDHQPVWIEFDF